VKFLVFGKKVHTCEFRTKRNVAIGVSTKDCTVNVVTCASSAIQYLLRCYRESLKLYLIENMLDFYSAYYKDLYYKVFCKLSVIKFFDKFCTVKFRTNL